jgi:hypothetical protein
MDGLTGGLGVWRDNELIFAFLISSRTSVPLGMSNNTRAMHRVSLVISRSVLNARSSCAAFRI